MVKETWLFSENDQGKYFFKVFSFNKTVCVKQTNVKQYLTRQHTGQHIFGKKQNSGFGKDSLRTGLLYTSWSWMY